MNDLVHECASKIRVEWRQASSWTSVWNSKGLMSRTKVGMWAPKLATFTRSNKISICLGQYAVKGLSKPKGDSRHYLVLSDTQSFGVFKSKNLDRRVINSLLPHPIKYHLAWMQQQGANSLYVWRPVPPSSDFIVLGMVATTTPDEPPLTEIRCVPKPWVVPSRIKPTKVWDDAGTGGRQGSMWVVNSLGLIHVCEGHRPPTEPFHDLFSRKFTASDHIGAMNFGSEELKADEGLDGADGEEAGLQAMQGSTDLMDDLMGVWEGPTGFAGPVLNVQHAPRMQSETFLRQKAEVLALVGSKEGTDAPPALQWTSTTDKYVTREQEIEIIATGEPAPAAGYQPPPLYLHLFFPPCFTRTRTLIRSPL